MASTTHHRHLTRKELRQPDEFMTFMDWAGDFISNNLGKVIAGVAALLVLVLIIIGIRFYLSQQTRLAGEAFYQASESFTHKDYSAAVKQFTALADEHPHGRLGRLARLYLGDAWMAQDQPAKARAEFQKFLADASDNEFRDLVLMQLGVTDENLGDLAGARRSYEQAAALNGPEQGRAQLSAARVMARQGDKKAAIAAYQRYLSENPFSQDRGEVADALAQLGATPPNAPTPKTIEIPNPK